MYEYIDSLLVEFNRKSDPYISEKQQDYMKGHFEFYGLTSPIRKELQRPFLVKNYLPSKSDLEKIVKPLWQQPQREVQYFAQELVQKYSKQFEKEDIELFEYMVSQKSWWDTVDFIASNILGPYFTKFPEERKPHVKKWISSNNLWLQRSAVIFQLKYKHDVDTELLSYAIYKLLGSKEFFINKAIGWSLRQYGKFNPGWVKDFVLRTPLEPLSRREALKLLV